MRRTSHTRRTAAAVLSGAALVAGLAIGAAPRARAAPGDCSAGALCLYRQPGFAGPPAEVFGALPGPVQGVRSVINASDCDALLTDAAGSVFTVPRGYLVPRIPMSRSITVIQVRWEDCR
ncbi:peptidase inhibitor family I36 protein [Streptomyces sp. NPDC091416]|uniref:peptidase inhibitor family I36 protein n=1 Tax=Streptomyces sp. NPDC091416 TaxID=3366003 RepID=UPI00380003DC